MPSERRQAARQSSNVPLDFYDQDGRMITAEGRFINVSTHGALVESRQRLKRRESVRLRVPAGSPSALELTGRVVWVRTKDPVFWYGIRFDAENAKSAA